MMAQTFGSAEDADLSGVGNVKQNSIQIKKINKLNIKAPKNSHLLLFILV